MLDLEMASTKAKKCPAVRLEFDRSECALLPSDVERGFACQLATSVWLAQLDHEEAQEALLAYVMARYRSRQAQARLRIALESEYHLCRERLDLCS